LHHGSSALPSHWEDDAKHALRAIQLPWRKSLRVSTVAGSRNWATAGRHIGQTRNGDCREHRQRTADELHLMVIPSMSQHGWRTPPKRASFREPQHLPSDTRRLFPRNGPHRSKANEIRTVYELSCENCSRTSPVVEDFPPRRPRCGAKALVNALHSVANRQGQVATILARPGCKSRSRRNPPREGKDLTWLEGRCFASAGPSSRGVFDLCAVMPVSPRRLRKPKPPPA